MTELNEKWFVFKNDQLLLIKQNEVLAIPSQNDLKLFENRLLRSHSLGLLHGIKCYSAELSETVLHQLPNAIFTPLKQSYAHLGEKWFYAAAKGFQILNWDKNHQYCGLFDSNQLQVH